MCTRGSAAAGDEGESPAPQVHDDSSEEEAVIEIAKQTCVGGCGAEITQTKYTAGRNPKKW